MARPLHKPGLPGNGTALSKRYYPRVLATCIDGREIRAIGREGAILLMLIQDGPVGVRAFDFAGGPAYRLSAYIHDLRRVEIRIRREFERHATGLNAVYVLESRIAIVKVDVDVRDE